MRKYERDIIKQKEQKKPSTVNIKRVLFARAVPYIDKLLKNGEICVMSDIVAFATSLVEEGEDLPSAFQNRDLKPHRVPSSVCDVRHSTRM